MTADDLPARIAAAHGGLDRWHQAGQLHVHACSGGPAFASKTVGTALHDFQATLSVTAQRIKLTGTHPRPWHAEFDNADTLAAHLRRLATGTRRLRWNITDLAAFTAAALWTYLTLPVTLTRPDVQIRVRPNTDHARDQRTLDIQFPDTIATHCPHQTIHIDADRRIVQHDYTALAFGPWARAGQLIDRYAWFDGLLIGTRRRVRPRLPAGHTAPWPTLVRIDIHQVTAGHRTARSSDATQRLTGDRQESAQPPRAHQRASTLNPGVRSQKSCQLIMA